MSDRILVHRLIAAGKAWPWRVCDGRISRTGELEHCVFRDLSNYEHRWAIVDDKSAIEEKADGVV